MVGTPVPLVVRTVACRGASEMGEDGETERGGCRPVVDAWLLSESVTMTVSVTPVVVPPV